MCDKESWFINVRYFGTLSDFLPHTVEYQQRENEPITTGDDGCGFKISTQSVCLCSTRVSLILPVVSLIAMHCCFVVVTYVDTAPMLCAMMLLQKPCC